MGTRAGRLAAQVALGISVAASAAADVWPVDNFVATWESANVRSGYGLLAADLDADGRDDLIAHGTMTDNRGGAWVYVSTGRGLEHRTSFADAEIDDQFGVALAAGDFAGNPGIVRPHFVLGHPGWPAGEAQGRVWIYTLDAAGDPALVNSFEQGQEGIPGASEAGDYFGRALAAGDFDGDGVEDLAIGAPGEDLAGGVDAGLVVVVYGGATGLDPTTGEIWHQGIAGVPDDSEPNDFFGYALAAGDFDGDGIDDLAVAAAGETVGALAYAGAVTILYGTFDGLDVAGAQWLTEGDGVVPGTAEADDYFGYSLAAGRLGHDDPSQAGADDEDDLAIGVPYETVGTEAQAGAVVVLLGRATGPTAAGAVRFNQNALPGGVAEAEDFLAFSLAVGDTSHDGWDELAVGVVGETHLGVVEHGVVHLLAGGPAGLDPGAAALVAPNAAFELSPLQTAAHFGAALAVPDLDGDGHGDLAVGAPGWDNGAATDAGAVQILFGALFADGLDAGDSAAWSTVAP